MSNESNAGDGTVMIEGVGGKAPWPGVAVLLLIGLPLTAVFTALATWWAVDHVEDQLVAETRDDFEANGLDPEEWRIDFDYRDGDAWGPLPNGLTERDAEAFVDHRLLRDFDVHQRGTVATATTATTVATADTDTSAADDVVELVGTDVEARLVDGVITLTGTVPSEAHRQALLDAVAAVVGADNVVDELVVADGAADDGADARIAALAAALGAAGATDDLTFALTDTTLDVDGTISATRRDGLDAALAAAADAGLDAGGDLEVIALGSTDASAVFDGETITLTGTVLTGRHRTQLVAAAASVVGAENVRDDLTVLDAEPLAAGADARVDEMADAIRSLGDAAGGTAKLTDDGVTVELDDGLADEAQIDELQVELDELAAEIRENVVFTTGSDVLDAGATTTLDKVVDAMTRHPLPVVEVVGHTDSTGDPDANRALSGARAQAVVDYLISQGIDAARLQSRGAGADEPIADNTTDDGRAQNRRVELTAAAEFVG
ncbi:MAG: OmpA family protein [Actinomycetota bacterium]